MRILRSGFRSSAAALVAAAALATAPVAQAHDSVVGGNVVSDAPLEEFPKEITLEFSAIPRGGFNTFAVTDTNSGDVIFDAEPTVDGRELTVETPEGVNPGPGHYQVGFQVMSSDGHATRGSVPFDVAVQAAGSSEESTMGDPVADAAQNASTPWKWIIAVGAVLAVIAVLILFAAKSRRND